MLPAEFAAKGRKFCLPGIGAGGNDLAAVAAYGRTTWGVATSVEHNVDVLGHLPPAPEIDSQSADTAMVCPGSSHYAAAQL